LQVWDPASRAQTRGMFGVVENLLIYLQPEDSNLQVRARLFASFALCVVCS